MQETSKPKKAKAFEKSLAKTGAKVQFNPAEMGMAPVDLQVLALGEAIPADLFLPIYKEDDKKIHMELASAKGDVFLEKWRESMAKNRQKRVFVRVEDARLMTDYFGVNAAKVINDGNTSLKKKAHAIKELASLGLRLTFTSDLTPKAMESCVGMADTMVSQITANPQVLNHLAEALSADFSVYNHSVNVAMISMAFARHLKESEPRVYTLGMAGMLHDLGMAKIPRKIIEKQGSLEPEEMRIVQTHTRLGYDLLKSISTVSFDCLRITLHHHENADGTGYPNRLKSAQIPYLARVVRLIDAFAAITSQRPHRDPRSNYEAASELIKGMEPHFGADLVPRFVKFLGSGAL